MGDVTEGTPTGTTDWTASLTSTYVKLLLNHGSSAAATKFTATTTTAGSSYIPLPHADRFTFGEWEHRISQGDMRAIVDRLVKERYPAYEPLDR